MLVIVLVTKVNRTSRLQGWTLTAGLLATSRVKETVSLIRLPTTKGWLNVANLIVRIPDELKVAMDNVCAKQDRTVSQIVRDLIRQYVRDNSQLEFEEMSQTHKKTRK